MFGTIRMNYQGLLPSSPADYAGLEQLLEDAGFTALEVWESYDHYR